MAHERPPVQRRSFLSRLTVGLGAVGAVFGASTGNAQRVRGEQWAPARHPQDDWLEEIPGQHRYFFDTSMPNGAGDAITFSNNYFIASTSAYGLEAMDLAVVICLRHLSTPFAYGDDVWRKYGAVFADRIKFNDPKTNAAPTTNVYNQPGYGALLTSRGTTLDSLVKKGVHFAVCDMATHAYAGMVAQKLGLSTAAVYDELKAGSIGNCHFVPAGIVAVNRAQERGYSLVQMA